MYIYTYCIIQRYYTQFKFWLPLMTYQKGVGCQHSQLVVDSCADLITFRNLYLACHTPFWICLVMIPFFGHVLDIILPYGGIFRIILIILHLYFHVFLGISMHFLLTSLVSRLKRDLGVAGEFLCVQKDPTWSRGAEVDHRNPCGWSYYPLVN